MKIQKWCLLACFTIGALSVYAQEVKQPEPATKAKWFEKISLRGYAQLRYNRLLETNENYACEQCDKSIGKNGGFFFRRARLVFSGQLHPRIYFYIQNDFATGVGKAGNYTQLRDAYVDVGLDDHNEFRIRFGQSKVLFGFDNLQSSQNRLAFDRSDAINSGAPNERELGVSAMYTPKSRKEIFKKVANAKLKGTGDYGMFGVMVYNGQSANRPEENNTPHISARFAYPFEWKNQLIELGVSGFTGQYYVGSDQISVGTKLKKNPDDSNNANYDDQRISVNFMLYPNPFGIQAEYNIGTSPAFNPDNQTIEQKDVNGGYVTLMYAFTVGGKSLVAFTRGQNYNGGKKHELDARMYDVQEVETGLEYHAYEQLELTAAYTYGKRTFQDFQKPVNSQTGGFLRLQAQLNF